MHLEIHELSIDRVLRWCVEMVLGTIEDAALTVFFEQTNGRGLHEIVHWRIWTFQNNLDLRALLVVFGLLSWINDIVSKVKVVVFELISDWHVSVKVDRCLQEAITNNTFLSLLK